jgi:hypothetical protein
MPTAIRFRLRLYSGLKGFKSIILRLAGPFVLLHSPGIGESPLCQSMLPSYRFSIPILQKGCGAIRALLDRNHPLVPRTRVDLNARYGNGQLSE